jgi:hypothetical protein
MLEISNLKVKYNHDTFQPTYKFEGTLSIPVEQSQDVDSVPMIAEAFYKKLGEDLYKKIRLQASLE